jgi:subtilisin family serine protease
MPDAHKTDGYLLGEVDEKVISILREQGMMVADLGPADAPDDEAADAVDDEGETPPAGEGAFYVVRVRGLLLTGRRSRLEEAGATVGEFIYPDAYLCRMDPESRNRVADLDFVRAAHSYGRDETPLLRARGGAAPEQGPSVGVEAPGQVDLASPGPAVVVFDVGIHGHGSRDRVAAWLEQQSARIVKSGPRKLRIEASSDAQFLDGLRRHGDVLMVEEYVEPITWNDISRVTLRLDPTEKAPTAILPLTGAGQVIAVADTGLDTAHPDFSADRIVQIFALGRPGIHDDPDGHGTHVAGSALGNGAGSSPGGATIRGIAPDARLVFQSLLDDQGRLGGLPVDLGDLLSQAYEAGARIHNNSWGQPTESQYRLSSREVDEFVWTHPDMLVVFAAGNEGSAVPSQGRVEPGFVDWLSIRAPATARNALTVGASRSPRTGGPTEHARYGDK